MSLQELLDDFESSHESDCEFNSLIPSDQKMNQDKLQSLPVDVLNRLAAYLTIREIRAMMSVSKFLSKVFQGDVVWFGLFEEVSRTRLVSPRMVCVPRSISISPPLETDSPHLVITSPEQLASYLIRQRHQIECLQSHKSSETKIGIAADSPPRHPWNLHMAIPSSFLSKFSLGNNIDQSSSVSLVHEYSGLFRRMWYFRYKQANSEMVCCRSWKSLAESWKWLRTNLRDRLFMIWRVACLHPRNPLRPSDFFFPPPPTLTRAAAKLTSINWMKFYETIKEEMILQIEAIARDIVDQHCLIFCRVVLPFDIEGHIEFLRYVLQLCYVYISWSVDLDNLLIPLSWQITSLGLDFPSSSSQPPKRAKTEQIPTIDIVGLLLLRNRCLMHWEVYEYTKTSILNLGAHLETSETNHRTDVIQTLLMLSDLVWKLGLPDETQCDLNKQIFRANYHELLRSFSSLLPHLSSDFKA